MKVYLEKLGFKNRERKQGYDENSKYLSLQIPSHKIMDEVSTFTHLFAFLTNTIHLSEPYKEFKYTDFPNIFYEPN